MILTDSPVQSEDEDKLRRLPLAKKVASMFLGFKDDESFVVGIEGPWGSGKTSFVNLILKELKKSPEILVVKFNPWNFTGQNELIEDFFTSLAAALKKTGSEDSNIKKIRRYAGKLMRKSEVVFNPEISAFGFSIKPGELYKFGGDKTLDDERGEIDAILKGVNKKILVVIDDIDRLDKEETRLILKLVKMTGNFPNSMFLLAYDREKVAARINENGWPGEEYLKKIIQVSFSLPEPDLQDLWNILYGGLNATIESIYGTFDLKEEDQKRWEGIFYNGFGKLFKTIRDIKHYITSLRLAWSMIDKDEVNVVDFMTIEVIRIFAPQFYVTIAANKSFFTGTFNVTDTLMKRIVARNDNQAKKDKYKEFLELVPQAIREDIDGICKELFPPLSGGYDGGEWQKIWRQEKRICSEERFGFYFQLGVPVGGVSEAEIKALMKALTSEEEFSDDLLALREQKKIGVVFEKIMDHVSALHENQLENLVVSAWNVVEKISEEKTDSFDFNDPESQVLRLAYQVVKHLDPEKRGSFLEKILPKTKTVYHPTAFISTLENEEKKRQQSVDSPLLEAAEIKKLEDVCIKKIKIAAEAGTLPKERRFIFILFKWRDWGSADAVRAYLAKMLGARAGLLEFLLAARSKVYSTSGNHFVLDKTPLGEIYPMEELEKMVAAITDEDLEKMTPQEREAVNLYRNPKTW